MLNVLRSSQPLAFVIVTVTWLLGLTLQIFVHIPEPFAWSFIDTHSLLPRYAWISNLLLVLPALALHQSYSNNEYAPHQNSLAVWIYLLLGSMFCLAFPLHPYLLAQTFFALSLHQIWQVYRQGDAKHLYFNASLLIGCSAIIVPNTSLIFLGLLVSLAYTRSGIWREWAWSIIGFILPPIMLIVILWCFNATEYLSHWLDNFGWNSKHNLSLSASIPLTLLTLWGVKELLATYSEISNKSRNTKTTALFMSISMIVVALFDLSNNVDLAWFLILPVVGLATPFIVLKNKRPWWMKAIFWALLLWSSLALVGGIFNYM